MAKSDTPVATTDPVLKELVERMVDAYHPLRIYLFGSRARESAQPESDYDILLIVDDDAPSKLKSAGKAYEVLWGIKVPVDVVVWTKDAFEKRLHIPASLPAQIAREGILLHVA